jgi:serine/threonine-protein kinase
VKILLGRAFGQPAALRRFRREAHAAARLNHPNIVSVYDFGSLEGQGAYLVMERVSGATLRAELERTPVMPPAVVIDWFDPLLEGLAAAHGHGIVHRDLKPENVIGRPYGPRLAVKILDFGLAKFHAAEPPASGTVTAEGAVLGTLGYMSPEQLLGGDIDPRSDIFSVGVMLAEALTGHRPFEGQSHAERTLSSAPFRLPASSPPAPAVEVVLQKCLAREPRDRYESAATLRNELLSGLRAAQA